jgi:hypothetical protein
MEINTLPRVMRNQEQKVHGKGPIVEGMSETPTHTMEPGSMGAQRPEGRDAAKTRRSKCAPETESSSVAVEMLRKIHEKGQCLNEQDKCYKDGYYGHWKV